MRITAKVTDESPSHTRLSVWVDGGLIVKPGGVCLRNEEVVEFLDHLTISPTKIKDKLRSMMATYKKIGDECADIQDITLEKIIVLQVVLDYVEQEERRMDLSVQGQWEITDGN